MARSYTHIKHRIIWLLPTLFLCACSFTQSQLRKNPIKTFQRRSPLNEQDRSRLTTIARSCIGKDSLKVGNKSYRNDCSGTIRAIFTMAKIGLGGIVKNNKENDVKAMYRYIQRYGTITRKDPLPGDLVFFHNTYDRSRNGRMNDALTHVGIVEKIEGTTIHFIHHLGQSIIRSRMDLSQPTESFHKETKSRINHVLRKAQTPYRAYTAAELFAGFGRL